MGTPKKMHANSCSRPWKIGNLNLGGPAPSVAPALPSQPSAPPANQPVDSVTRNSTTAGAPPAAPAKSGPTGAPVSLPESYCVINDKPYPAPYNRERNR